MEMSTTMLISALTSLFAVGLLFLALLFSGHSGRSGGKAAGVFKTGNPTLAGRVSTQGLQQGHVDVSATLEGARHGVSGSSEPEPQLDPEPHSPPTLR